MRRYLARTFLVFCACLTLSAGVQSDAAPPRNGFWWLGMSRVERMMFIEGYVDGVSRADKLVRMYIEIETLKLNPKANREVILGNLNFYQIAYGQYLDALTRFIRIFAISGFCSTTRQCTLETRYAAFPLRNWMNV
jgi:hypothetical protein